MLQASEAIWYQFSTNLKRFIQKRVGNNQVADDILQDVFIKIHLHLDSLEDETRLQSWIYQITRNTIADYYRRESNPPAPLEEFLPAADDADDAFRAGLAQSVQRMIESLPDEYRTALLLDTQGVPQAEIGARLGISLPGAKSRVQRARAKLRQMLFDCCHFEFDRVGKVIDYHPRSDCCSQCGCSPELLNS
ncbi:MAG TPA: RNA polymerase sigma factor SigZ [Anaerolineae bacterium]|nr:RNA polymerase sigma factor SigZ [Anaerolineae bacterium]